MISSSFKPGTVLFHQDPYREFLRLDLLCPTICHPAALIGPAKLAPSYVSSHRSPTCSSDA